MSKLARQYSAFEKQFIQDKGKIIYRPAPAYMFSRSNEPRYIVTAAERDRFILAFAAEADELDRKSRRDIQLAVLSMFLSTLLLRIIPVGVEVFILVAHVFAVFLIQQRRLQKLWQAPKIALANRVPFIMPVEDDPGLVGKGGVLQKIQTILAFGLLLAVFAVSVFRTAEKEMFGHIPVDEEKIIFIMLSVFVCVLLLQAVIWVGQRDWNSKNRLG